VEQKVPARKGKHFLGGEYPQDRQSQIASPRERGGKRAASLDVEASNWGGGGKEKTKLRSREAVGQKRLQDIVVKSRLKNGEDQKGGAWNKRNL